MDKRQAAWRKAAPCSSGFSSDFRPKSMPPRSYDSYYRIQVGDPLILFHSRGSLWHAVTLRWTSILSRMATTDDQNAHLLLASDPALYDLWPLGISARHAA